MTANPSDRPPSQPLVLEDDELEALASGLGDESSASSAAHRLQELRAKRGDSLFADAVWNLAHIEYDAPRARDLWEAVIKHRESLSQKLGRDVGLRVAAIDYFVNIAREIGSARVVHHDVLMQLREDATRDPLTGLLNRRAYREALAHELHRAERYGSEFVIGVFDLDNFKKLNDTAGHTIGDRVLKQTADIIKSSIRNTDLATRWGGEEFVVLMPETTKVGATELAQRIRRSIEQELAGDGVTVSGGLAVYPTDGADERSLFVYADRALYRAKHEGKNRIATEPQERRRFRRADEEFSIRVITNENTPEIEARTTNFGQGGFSFITPSPPPVSTLLEGSVEMEGRLRRFRGRVIYVEESTTGQYDVGVQFLEPEDRSD